MKKFWLVILFFSLLMSYSQENSSSFQVDYFHGNIIVHSYELKPIAQSHPTGFLVSWNKKNTGDSEFEHNYNFPDFGFSASYEDFKTEELGKVYAAYAHYNFHLTNRNAKHKVKLTSAFGLGYNTNPFDKATNPKNWAIGSKFLASAYLKLNYYRDNIIDRLGINGGLLFIHYSNASFKAPNLGINTVALNLGVNYNLQKEKMAPEKTINREKIDSKIDYNAILRAGFNESLINGSGVYPFYTVSLSASKKLNYKSTISAGTDVFFATFMKDHIKLENSINETPNNDKDWKRVGIFVGHELNMDHFSVLTEVGYHVYAPYRYVSGVYERFGFRKKISEHLFADLSLKINLFRAEGLEFGIGYKF